MKAKRTIALILTICMMLTFTNFPVMAATTETIIWGTNLRWAIDDSRTLTISGTGAIPNYTYSSKSPWQRSRIENVVIEQGVTAIGDYAFFDMEFTSIVIPDSVTAIGSKAFQGCETVTDIAIPDNVTSIGDSAFMNCKSLTSITIPNGVTTIEDGTFDGCESMTSVTIPDSVIKIGDFAFEGCSSLKSITIPDDVTTVGGWAFCYCESLKSVTIPNGVTSIGEQTFYRCTALEEIVIPSDVIEIGYEAFGDCSKLANVYYVGTEIQKEAISVDNFGNDCLTKATWHYVPCYYGHSYGDVCDAECDICEEVRVAPHVYDDPCDSECNECEATREAPHTYDNACDVECNACGETRTAPHIFDNDCDVQCNECTVIREIQHTYTADCDTDCNICSETREAEEHTYSNVCDASCDKCNAARYLIDTLTITPISSPNAYAGYDIAKVLDGDLTTGFATSAYFSNISTPQNAHSLVFDLGKIVMLDTLKLSWGLGKWGYTIADSYKVYVSDDNVNYTEIKSYQGLIADKNTYDGTVQYIEAGYNDNGAQLRAVVNERKLGIKNVRYIKIELVAWKYRCTLAEVEVICSEEPHSYDNACDIECNVCDGTRKVPDHVYDNACDANCNICGDVRTQLHVFDNSCDTECNECGEIRETQHTYTADCDVECNECGDIREAEEHTYDNVCDGECNKCETVRKAPHIYDNTCDIDCNECGHKRYFDGKLVITPVSSSGSLWSSSDEYVVDKAVDGDLATAYVTSTYLSSIGNAATSSSLIFDLGKIVMLDTLKLSWGIGVWGKMVPEAYKVYVSKDNVDYTEVLYYTGLLSEENDYGGKIVFSGYSDSRANRNAVVTETGLNFENVRYIKIEITAWQYHAALAEIEVLGEPEIPHTYDNACDTDCNVCGEIRETEHTYTAACDVECNECGELREAEEHIYDNACDADCNTCGDTRTVSDHIYDDSCDADCNACGDVRTAPHVFDNKCDAECNDCGAPQELSNHYYTSDKDISCNECGHLRLVEGAPTFVVESKIIDPNQTFTIDVSIKNNPGIIGLRVYVGYDSEVLELVKITGNDDFDDTSFGPLTQNPISILWDDALELQGNAKNGVIATLTFRVKIAGKVGASDIRLTYAPDDVYDSNWNNVEFAVENGTVNIIDYISGDVNGDGKVNNKDLGILRQHLNDWDVTVDLLAADVNRDGKVNNKDLGILRQYLNGWDVELK